MRCFYRPQFQQVGAADDFLYAPHAHGGQVFPHFLRQKGEEVNQVIGVSLEAFAQRFVLRGHAHRADVQVALAHHHAAQHDERTGGEAVFLGAQQGGDDNVLAGFQLSVGLQADVAAQVIHHECLLRLGQSQLARYAGMFDGTYRTGARAALASADEDEVGFRFGYAGGNGAHAALGH